ncbi:molybdopterin-binding protein [Bradyrhizobium iriomotense]|uniref:Molybdopterin molybdenumtransferase n=1 Tax=Bradyrhizobium iriomotense TaxID=441950 RepID=A0ABQ6B3X6_9BRAD|nr:molybdopterin-binding protein [Bradyrhizobium iriomotense]GLR88473.1 molybdopterin-binding protein [Bradyrhizobium iriomotense]
MTQRLPPSLTPLDLALAALLRGVEPVTPVDLPLTEVLGCVAAGMLPLGAYPPYDIAASDGWALRASDLVGASSYSPLRLAAPPVWVDAGDAMPEGCDCVLDADAVDMAGPITEVLTEGFPGRGVRRTGSDMAADISIVSAGLPVRATGLLLARAAELKTLSVRRPRLRIVNTPGGTVAAQLIEDQARAAGAQVTAAEASARDAASIANVLDTSACDLLLTIGGSGVGRKDAAVAALADRGEVLAHGIAMQPGRTAAIGKLGSVPVIALPGAPDQAFAAWLAVACPVLDHRSARASRKSVAMPLARKIASNVGMAEIALLAEEQGAWLPLAVGELSLQAIARADAWLLVPGDSEGFAAGAPVDAYLMRE